MVVVFAACLDVEVTLHGGTEALEEVAEHLGGGVADIFAGKGDVPAEVDASAEIKKHQSVALVHRQREAVALDAPLVAQRL